MAERRTKLIPEMEGRSARWYARQRGTPGQLATYRRQAPELTAGLAEKAEILEVAPGPGYQAIEVARLGFHVTGLDVSRTMVALATEAGDRAGVDVDFRHGDVTEMPFGEDTFDLIICQAAFKNFTEPGRALNEMHRVLRPGGTAVIQDMNHDAPGPAIDEEVDRMGLTPVNAWPVKLTLRWLRRRAYSPGRFLDLAAHSRFGAGEITATGIGLELRLTR